MNSFKAGDRVKCVDAEGTLTLEVGKEYTIKKVDVSTIGTTFLRLEGLKGIIAWYYAARFELVKTNDEESKEKVVQKPFNLERALAGDPVMTKAGERITQLTKFETNGNYCLVGVGKNGEFPTAFTKDGKYCPPNSSDKDLVMAPKKVKIYTYLYKNPIRDVYYTDSAFTYLPSTLAHLPETPECVFIKEVCIEVEE